MAPGPVGPELAGDRRQVLEKMPPMRFEHKASMFAH